jgi:hypothetical protein
VIGDRYAGEFPRELFRKRGIHYEPSEDMFRNDLYIFLLPLLNSGRIELLDIPRIVSQFCSLERRTHPSGKDTIDHQRSASSHDDVANAIAGVAWMCMSKGASIASLITPEVLAKSKIPMSSRSYTSYPSRFGGRGAQQPKVYFR